MKAWEIWTLEGHPCLIVSNQRRVETKGKLVVIKGQTLYSGDNPATAFETVLDETEGLDRATVFTCDLFFTAKKHELTNRRGEVTSTERKRDISRKMIQGLAIAGL